MAGISNHLRRVSDLYLDFGAEILHYRIGIYERPAQLIAQIETFRLAAAASRIGGLSGGRDRLDFDSLLELVGFSTSAVDEKTRVLFSRVAGRVADEMSKRLAAEQFVSGSVLMLYADRSTAAERLIASSARALISGVLHGGDADLDAGATSDKIYGQLDRISDSADRVTDIATLPDLAAMYSKDAAEGVGAEGLAELITQQLVATISAMAVPDESSS